MVLKQQTTQATEADGRLKKLGLTVEDLVSALQMGETARNSCTPNDPAALPGILAWGRVTRGLREVLAPKAWRREEIGGLSLVVSPNNSMAITVATGDSNTGWLLDSPRTKYPRGPATVMAVEQNQQLDFFMPNPPPKASPVAIRATWLLLFARAGKRVNAELSLPAGVDDQGHVVEWAERILLPRFEVDEAQLPDDAADDELDIDVNVSRKPKPKKEE
jgi:hypothetical protein